MSAAAAQSCQQSTAPYRIAVRELCEFAAKQGDLDLRFTPAPTAQEGIAGHGSVVARRGAGYRAELALQGSYRERLLVRGRADGYDPARGLLEEIKTHKGSLEQQPAAHRALHWAQARVYAHLLCASEGLAALEVGLVYFEIGSQAETRFVEAHDAAALRAFFEQLCERFLGWAEQELAHRAARDAALRTLSFPFAEFRAGQRALAEGVYKAAALQRSLLAQAPTGIGKTVATLFPLLKAMPLQGLDKLFFLAAKTSGRQPALQALQRIAGGGRAPLRVLELVARDKACVHPDKACHGESCPLARGFYDRLPAARAAALADAGDAGAGAALDVRGVAAAHEVCPYYLSQELARWADVVVGDYNYFFDLGALLHALTELNGWAVGLLVDEAHNLVERGRKMFSATLSADSLARARASPTAQAQPPIRKALDKLRRGWKALDQAQAEDYAVLPEFPAALQGALQQFTGLVTEQLARQPAPPDPLLQDFYFEALHLLRLAETLDSHSLIDLERPHGALALRRWRAATLTIRNVVPAPFLKPRFAAARTCTLFSATLQPWHFFADLLGLPADHGRLDVASPFSAAQLELRVASHISTRWRDRAGSLDAVVDLMAAQYTRAPGNYLAFFSSHAYLAEVAARLAERHPALPIWAQERGMGEAAQQAFLARFEAEGAGGIGLAVLGGSFAEGVDLPGRRLIGAFIATLGLPQLNPVNEQLRARMQQLFGAGYDYAYLYPGLQKVVQAAGRVIRTPEDRGVVHLLDDRFGRAEVRALLPGWWALPG
jgi:Rad3-related DNA helicase